MRISTQKLLKNFLKLNKTLNKLIPILFLAGVGMLLLTTCEERPRSNPLDPDTELDPSEWAPSNLQAQVINDSQIKLTWTQVDERISGFRIDRKADSGSFSQIAEVEKVVREYTDTGLTVGTDYTYRVTAFTDENESDYATSNTTNTSFPSPTNLVATPLNDTDIQLLWNDNCSFEDGYKLERTEDGVTFTQIAELDENIIEYVDTGLTLGTDYTYRVKAFTDENESGYSTSNTTTMSIPSPSNLVATPIDDQSIQLTWSDNCVCENGYRLERSENAATFTQIAELGANSTTYTDTGLNFGTDYTYRVKAFTDENESGYATSNTTTMNIPIPSNLTATPIDDQSIQLNWSDNCSFENGYRVERSSGGSFTQIAELEANVTEYTNTGLTLGTDYTYRVKAFTDENESGYATSNTTNTSFPAPTNLTATPLNDSEIQLNWSDNCSFEVGCRVERSSGGSFTQIAEVDGDVTEYMNTGLNYGTDYTYRVKAFTDANESDYAETTVNFWQDCNGVWGGSTVEDCNGDCDGTAFESECGCVGGNTGLEEGFCYGCTDPGAYNYDPDATIDDGSCNILTDIDGNVYQAIQIGNQFWMTENLKVTHYRNGDMISHLPDDGDWENTTSGAYCAYNNDQDNVEIYGLLYNWYAIDDSRNIAPEGWHIPTEGNWVTLRNYLGGSSYAGGKMKTTGTIEGGDGLWYDPNTGATNESGFSGIPGGYRYYYVGYGNEYYTYSSIGGSAFFWASTSEPYNVQLDYNYSVLWGDHTPSWLEKTGFSVRCVKD